MADHVVKSATCGGHGEGDFGGDGDANASCTPRPATEHSLSESAEVGCKVGPAASTSV